MLIKIVYDGRSLTRCRFARALTHWFISRRVISVTHLSHCNWNHVSESEI